MIDVGERSRVAVSARGALTSSPLERFNGAELPSGFRGSFLHANTSFRTEMRARIWQSVLQEFGVGQEDTVLELCPGESLKIGTALQKMRFCGTLFLLEPSRECGQRLLDRYRALLPDATVSWIPQRLEECTLTGLDAVVSNHPIDDLLLGEVVSPQQWEEVWGDIYNDPAVSLARTQQIWGELESDPERLGQIMSKVAGDLEGFVRRARPRLVAIYQYPSTTQMRAGFEAPTRHAARVLEMLKEGELVQNGLVAQRLRSKEQSPKQWLVLPEVESLEQEMKKAPRAISRLGAQTFLPCPLEMRSGEGAGTVAFDPLLAERYFDYSKRDSDQIRNQMAEYFAVDICDTEKGGGTVHVDYQCDPSGIALGENRGSGRAGYLGSVFNLKGIGRTPLVNSPPESVHGTGRLNLFKGAWEMIVANTVYRHFRSGASPVLALVSLGFSFPLKGEEWLAVNAVREDRGTLDRPAHLLLPHLQSRETDLLEVARAFGRQDAEKFIEQIVHNAWSAGNISLDGAMLDFDTVSSVPARCPHYTYNSKYPAVLFGLEGEGQKYLLEIMRENLQCGAEYSPRDLQGEFDSARSQFLSRRMLDLFGLSQDEQEFVVSDMGAKLDELADLFQRYAQKMYPDYAALSVADSRSDSPAVFDFSRLFRGLPLHFALGRPLSVLKEEGMKLLVREGGAFALQANEKLSPECQKHLEAHYVVSSPDELHSVLSGAGGFVHRQ